MPADYPIITGKISIYGIKGDIALTGWLTAMEENPQSMEWSRTVEKLPLKNPSGVTISQIYHSPKETLTATLIPYDPTGSGGTDAALLALWKAAPPGVEVVISGSSPDLNGNWNSTGDSEIKMEPNGWGTITLKLERPTESSSAGGAAASLQLVVIP